jgi:hypothetical protein
LEAALGEAPFFKKKKKIFPECPGGGTRGSPFFRKKKNTSSPSATAQTLGEATSNFFKKNYFSV